ncbi:methylated-DNA--[protein]-cysteine S-methyltransferase [Fervidibacillus halotolerans]|uniref:Methylated-DNA--protein-cysteine methyltransferase n=1 Tax=Fervidibacillus halotolerans TaxID=2980027 RepID=A0A9E8M2H2_9BACI|nr:methylated-DNA--[protein]-cysteine S-methyltransferase [Fervidibacillus halotolerans]WAA13209.1 methylated-DNA--[protein]-cysteine S-methyltransferase [Fervidibacillus halotolerans]
MSYEYISFQTMVGNLFLVAEKNTVRRLFFCKKQMFDWVGREQMSENPNHPILSLGKKQLEEYMDGKRREFQLPFTINEGTSFQGTVWRSLMNIPYGETVSYQQIAQSIGNEKAVRAVGQANRKNPLPIIIPCHRVIGKDGSLTGYAGNRLEIKKRLLLLEKRVVKNN